MMVTRLAVSRRFFCSNPGQKIFVTRTDREPKPVTATYPASDPNSPPMLATPLSEPPKSFPKAVYKTDQQKTMLDLNKCHVTTLKNGLRVASQRMFGQFCTVGVIVDAGSRHEVDYTSGICHVLEKLAFQGTTKFKNRDAVLVELEKVGGICDAQTSRDVTIYGTSADCRGVETAVDVLSDCILRPLINDSELMTARGAIAAELETLDMSPTHDIKMAEWGHQAAYSSNTLGLPKLCPEENLAKIDKNSLLKYLSTYYRPDRMVLCGVGVEHEKLVDLAEKYFVDKVPSWKDVKPGTIDQSVAQYTGGCKKIEKDLSNISLGPNPLPNLAHAVLGFESVSHSDFENFVPTCVLASLMGGGGSFSAGGPGKGMYSRLYLNVLNRHHWIHHAQAMNVSYSDTGFFYMLASADPSALGNLLDVMTKEIILMATPRYKTEEVERAKAQLQSLLLMNLEQRPVAFEDIGRQVLFHGSRRDPSEYYEAIGKVTSDDLLRIAERLLSTKLTMVGFGDLQQLPAYEKVQSVIAKRKSLFMSSRHNSVFRFFG